MKKKTIIGILIILIAIIGYSIEDDILKNNDTNDENEYGFFASEELGTPFSTFFSTSQLVDKEIFAIAQDTLGRYIFANRRGLMTFNSKDYSFIKTPGMPYKIASDPYTNRIYVACNNSIGYLDLTETGYVYQEITNKVDRFIGDVDIFYTKKNISFYYKNFIVVYSKEDYSIKIIKPAEGEFYGGIVQQDGVNYVLIKGIGMCEILPEKISDTVAFEISEIIEITFSVELRQSNVFGTTENEIFIVSEDDFVKIDSKKIEYLEDKIISDAIAVDENIVAIATLNGGVVFLDVKKEKIISILNNITGLPDNEVFSIFKDSDGGVLISNNYGLFRYDLSLPVYNYGNLLGLQGNIITTHVLDTTVYVLTTQGVFYLTKATSDEEFEKVIKEAEEQKQKTNTQTNVQVGSEDIIADVEEIENENVEGNTKEKKEKRLKKWANKIFGKKKKDKDNEDDNEDDNENQNDNNSENNQDVQDTTQVVSVDTTIVNTPIVEPQQVYVYKKTKKKQFSDLYYIYKKIDGINSKCKQVIEYNNQLLVSSNNGLYLIKNNKSKQIIEEEYITKVSQSSENENEFYVATTDYLYKLTFNGNTTKKDIIISTSEIEDYILSIAETENVIWLGGEGYAYKINKQDYEDINMYPLSPDFLSVVEIQKLNSNIHFYIPQGMYKYNEGLDSIVKYLEFTEVDANSVYFMNKQDKYIWSKLKDKLHFNGIDLKIEDTKLKLLNIFPNITDISVDNNNNLWIVSNNSSLHKIVLKHTNDDFLENDFELSIKKLKINDSIYKSEGITVQYRENLSMNVELEAPFYVVNDKIEYQYATATKGGSTSLWTKPSEETNFNIPLNVGTYSFYFRAINSLGQESFMKIITVTIKPPFWQTELFKAIIALGVILLIIIFAYTRQRLLKRKNEHLENIVTIRTAQITKQNEELKTQSEEINRQNELVKEQRDKIKDSHEYITQSINYARRIQRAILPASEILSRNFRDHFIISYPKDIVSGDFYWFKEYKNKIFLTVADCTGHGVPGAFLSMMGVAYLNEVITYRDNITAAEILNFLRENIIYSLQEKKDNDIRDGMDMSFIILDKETKKLQFAGAYNPLLIIRNEELIEYKADKMPIGFSRKNDKNFTNHDFEYQAGDILYLFSDGYPDQFGGKNMRKFMIGNFKKLLLNISDSPMNIQNELLQTAFKHWKGNTPQIDDVTIVGVKI